MQYAVLQRGLNLVGIDLEGQRDHAREAAAAALLPVEAFLAFARVLSRTLDGQFVSDHEDLYVFHSHSGQFGLGVEIVTFFPDVQSGIGSPLLERPGHGVEELTQLATKLCRTSQWLSIEKHDAILQSPVFFTAPPAVRGRQNRMGQRLPLTNRAAPAKGE